MHAVFGSGLLALIAAYGAWLAWVAANSRFTGG
jgi:hypothetical protein